MADKHPNAPGFCPVSSDAISQTNKDCKKNVFNWLRDSEVAQQAEEGLTLSQMIQIGRRGGGLAEEWDATVTRARHVEMTCVTISFVWVVHTTLLGLLLLDDKLYCVLQNFFCIG